MGGNENLRLEMISVHVACGRGCSLKVGIHNMLFTMDYLYKSFDKYACSKSRDETRYKK